MTQLAKIDILGRKQTSLEMKEEHLEGPSHSLGQCSKVPRKFPYQGCPLAQSVLRKVTVELQLRHFAVGVGSGPFWEGVWPCLGPWDSVRLRTASTHWNVPRKYGPHGELFFFLL